MLETAVNTNFPTGVVINHSYATLKTGRVSVILINATNRNIWIRQPLLAADNYEVESHPWQYCANSNREGSDIKINFQLVFPLEIENNLQNNQVEPEVKSEASEAWESPQPAFGPHPDISLNYNFVEDKVLWLLFRFNMGYTPLNMEQQDWLLKLIYDYKEVFYSKMRI